MSRPLESVVLEPRSGRVDGVVVWLHGLGADGHDFAPVVPMLHRSDLRFVLPHAPHRAVTINMGYVMRAWYDLRSLESRPDREPESDIREAEQLLAAVIQGQLDATGLPAERVALVGFSQGAAMALHVGLRWPQQLAGIAALSGYLLLPGHLEREASAANRSTPILVCHGRQDPMVPCTAGEAARDALQRAGYAVRFQAYPMAHEVCPEEIELVRTWLGTCLPVRA